MKRKASAIKPTALERRTLAAACAVAMPPPDLGLTDWSEANVVLSAEYSAVPGRFQAYPWQRGWYDALNDPRVHVISLLKSARITYTQFLMNAIGYHIDQDPCSMLVVQPTVDDAQGFSKEQLEPFIRECDALRNKVADAKSRDKTSTILRKLFPGGQLVLTGANSARGFRRIAVRKVFFDEVDAYPPEAGQEGDQIKLGTKRTGTFWNWQIVLGSTPTIKGMSRIEAAFDASDKRHYFVPCPWCNLMQPLTWGALQWKEPYSKEDPHFVCGGCGKGFGYEWHHRLMEAGEWRGTAPFTDHAGFRLWAAYSYSPDCVWSKLVSQFYDSKESPLTLRTFVNTVLGETWEDKGEEVKPMALLERVENYGPEVPAKVVAITVGVDVQDNRLELEVVGWGAGDETWNLDYAVIFGSPAEPFVWTELDKHLFREWRTADGRTLRVSCMGVDSGGHFTKQVYDYASKRHLNRVFALKGVPGDGRPLASRPHKASVRRVRVVLVGTFTAKQLLYSRLRQTEPGPGYCHFPRERDAEYFAGLTAEKCYTRYRKGFPVRVWEKPDSARNEPLDCRVYAMAAKDLLKIDLDKLSAELAAEPEGEAPSKEDANLESGDAPVAPTFTRRPVVPTQFNRPRHGGGGFVNAWR